MSVDVSIIIVNYNTIQLTSECIRSILKFTKNINYEIILVDNASVDGSKEVFSSDDSINYIYSDINLGFGRANNLGSKHAKGKFLFLLNSDTILKENSIFILHEFFEKYEKSLQIGVLGCRLVNDDNIPNSYGGDFPDINIERNILIKSIFKSKRININRNINDERIIVDDYNLIKLDYVIGADMFLRKDVFDLLEGFDKHIFMYYEESDLQKRIKDKLSSKNYILQNSTIIHLEGKSSKKKNHNIISMKTHQMINESLFYYLKRHYNSKKVNAFIILHFMHTILNFMNFKYSIFEKVENFRFNLKLYKFK